MDKQLRIMRAFGTLKTLITNEKIRRGIERLESECKDEMSTQGKNGLCFAIFGKPPKDCTDDEKRELRAEYKRRERRAAAIREAEELLPEVKCSCGATYKAKTTATICPNCKKNAYWQVEPLEYKPYLEKLEQLGELTEIQAERLNTIREICARYLKSASRENKE
jgi:hypothetical protein